LLKNTKILSNKNDVTTVIEGSVALCYGHFNLIHPGHLRYLQHSKSLADVLVVAIKSDRELKEESFGKYFSEEERSESVSNLEIVDIVVVLNGLTLEELVNIIKPKVLVLGKEFEQRKTKQVNLAIDAVNRQGETVFHAGEIHYATTNLLHGNVLDIDSNSRSQLNKICKKYKMRCI